MSESWPDKTQFLALAAQVQTPPAIFLGQGQETEAGTVPFGATSQQDLTELTIALSGARGGAVAVALAGSVSLSQVLAHLSSVTLTLTDGTVIYAWDTSSPAFLTPRLEGGGYRLTFPMALPLAQGAVLHLTLSSSVTWTGAASVTTSAQIQTVEARNGGALISGWTPAVRLLYPAPSVYGQFAGQHLPAYASPSDSAIGLGALVLIRPDGAAPYLLYVDAQGSPYHTLLTAGLPQ